ncbi:MAG: TolC family protein [Bacteroidetes bacterium]|nr:TolC family protein [Bacteroidota bacterium]
MIKTVVYKSVLPLSMALLCRCKSLNISVRSENKKVPATYANHTQDSAGIAKMRWREYFTDPNLVELIDTALKNNQELNIILQEIEMSKNEIQAKKGEYLPFVNIAGGSGYQKDGRYTWREALSENADGKTNQDNTIIHSNSDYYIGAFASWELDVWKKLRNAKQAAVERYLAGVEGKNYMVTGLVAEIANSYYELVALDKQLDIVQKNIEIQSNALMIVKLQKESAKVTQLAVNRFEALLLNTQNLQYALKQGIVEAENRINFLTGRFPKPIKISTEEFDIVSLDSIAPGIPSQLLMNRRDIQQAELELEAAKLDVKSARANFYPSFKIQAGTAFQAFNPAFLIHPESLLFSMAGDLMAPLVNRNAIKATYKNANAKQIQAVYHYEQTILNAYLEVSNQLSRNKNFVMSYDTKFKESEILTQSVTISNDLFRSARADYIEVLLTQREALQTKMELVEIRLQQMNARVNVYRALGGGWK